MKQQYPFFVSQNEQDFFPEVSCGAASLMMLLKASKFNTIPNYASLCEQLCLTKPPIEKGYDDDNTMIGLYPEDLFRYAIQYQLRFRMHFFDDEWQKQLKIAPIMVLMAGNVEEFGLTSHWVVLVDRKKDFFTYLDPWYKSSESFVRYISRIDFDRYYTGIALQIL